MRWLLAGCCVLGLIGLSATLPQLIQRPRFIGVKTGHNVLIKCCPKPPLQATMHWSKADAHNTTKIEVKGERFRFYYRDFTNNTFLSIHNVKAEDSGVYFCNMDNTVGPGTQLLVVKSTDFVQARYRSMMKDGLIVFQGLLLALWIPAILLRRKTLFLFDQSEKKDSIYEEPETDHIYQGLEIEPCGGGLYEELSVYAQADGTEAPWE